MAIKFFDVSGINYEDIGEIIFPILSENAEEVVLLKDEEYGFMSGDKEDYLYNIKEEYASYESVKIDILPDIKCIVVDNTFILVTTESNKVDLEEVVKSSQVERLISTTR